MFKHGTPEHTYNNTFQFSGKYKALTCHFTIFQKEKPKVMVERPSQFLEINLKLKSTLEMRFFSF